MRLAGPGHVVGQKAAACGGLGARGRPRRGAGQVEQVGGKAARHARQGHAGWEEAPDDEQFQGLGESGLVLRGRLCLAVDNTAAIDICVNPGVTARNKHFSDAVHYVRHEYDHGRIRLVFVTTDKQRADGFTKPLESAAFYKWRRHIISAHPPI